MIFKYEILFIILSISSVTYSFIILKKLKFNGNINLLEEIEYLTLYNKILNEEHLSYNNEIVRLNNFFINEKIIDLKENEFFLLRFNSGYSALDVLLINKYWECDNKNIKTSFNINNIKNKKVKAVDLCTIVGNVLDNAIYCSENNYEKEIYLEIKEEKNKLIINISNLSKTLDTFIKENIFKKGITTKVGENNGFGLFLIKNIIENYQGNITLEEIKNKVIFKIKI